MAILFCLDPVIEGTGESVFRTRCIITTLSFSFCCLSALLLLLLGGLYCCNLVDLKRSKGFAALIAITVIMCESEIIYLLTPRFTMTALLHLPPTNTPALTFTYSFFIPTPLYKLKFYGSTFDLTNGVRESHVNLNDKWTTWTKYIGML